MTHYDNIQHDHDYLDNNLDNYLDSGEITPTTDNLHSQIFETYSYLSEYSDLHDLIEDPHLLHQFEDGFLDLLSTPFVQQTDNSTKIQQSIPINSSTPISYYDQLYFKPLFNISINNPPALDSAQTETFRRLVSNIQLNQLNLTDPIIESLTWITHHLGPISTLSLTHKLPVHAQYDLNSQFHVKTLSTSFHILLLIPLLLLAKVFAQKLNSQANLQANSFKKPRCV